ncbi:GMC oxidoreductase [Phycicoccus sp. Soil803]|uniref:GMC oxidoreductase n=1 Tax=Phycicoccus sp. Soil803 TaxID=1736415 RepID=UPI0007101D22|nr:GMC oxidoreductase [Phycicoccus sp. Soil803]KRF25997.1 choline dehydrogenase [Phycicoccus sp. Soil803]
MSRNFPSRVDVAIVGSGPTGAAYARVLSELRPDLDLVTFEVGPLLADPPGLHVKNIVDAEERAAAQRRSEGPGALGAEDRRLRRAGTYLLPEGFQQPGEDGIPSLAMSSNVGGMGAHWTAACPRPGDSEVIPFIDDLDELLDEAGRLLGVSSHAFDDAPFADEVRARLASIFDDSRPTGRKVQPMPLAVQTHDDGRVTWSGSDVVYGEATRTNPRHTLVPEALVRQLRVHDGTVTGVVVRDLVDGSDHEVEAGQVVVAADGVRTPQLLWASGIRPRALGRYLNDQSQVIFAARLRDVSPRDAAQGEEPGKPAIAWQSGVSWVPFTDAEPFHGQVMQLDASPVPLAADDVVEPGSIVGLGWFCAKELQETDRLEFDDDRTDSYGMPAIRVHYTLTDGDRATLDGAREMVKRAALALGDPLDAEPITLPAGASLHYQGTVRMGPVDDGTSVCDPRSRVWGVDALRVAGNGVIPTSTACNPTLTSVALAVAGARDLATTYPKKEGSQP